MVDGTKIKYNDIEDWQCSEGVVLAEDGSIQINQGANLFASIITYGVNSSITEEDIPGEIYPEYPENNASQSITIGEALDNQNYMYTQAELKEMISEKESEIDNLKFSKRHAEIDLSNAEKILETGNEVAEISGGSTKRGFVHNNYKRLYNKCSRLSKRKRFTVSFCWYVSYCYKQCRWWGK